MRATGQLRVIPATAGNIRCAATGPTSPTLRPSQTPTERTSLHSIVRRQSHRCCRTSAGSQVRSEHSTGHQPRNQNSQRPTCVNTNRNCTLGGEAKILSRRPAKSPEQSNCQLCMLGSQNSASDPEPNDWPCPRCPPPYERRLRTRMNASVDSSHHDQRSVRLAQRIDFKELSPLGSTFRLRRRQSSTARAN